MYRDHQPDRRAADEDTTAVSECPVCRSPNVKTTSKVVTAESYWRCESCGEIWNAGRRKVQNRYSR